MRSEFDFTQLHRDWSGSFQRDGTAFRMWRERVFPKTYAQTRPLARCARIFADPIQIMMVVSDPCLIRHLIREAWRTRIIYGQCCYSILFDKYRAAACGPHVIPLPVRQNPRAVESRGSGGWEGKKCNRPVVAW